ncbi:MAG: sigma-E processing peptidase SpoIIGA [Clostridia bacterium]|nr:sigma-E processing peptidase SpoIIGA [Clostridia bacterium]
MQTLYVDVFFLVNFTVDILAAHIALRFSKIRGSVRRIVAISALGALVALADVLFIEALFISLLLSVLYLFLAGRLITGQARFFRRLRFVVIYVISEVVIGGTVYSAYSLLDRYIGEEGFSAVGAENRSALVFSLIILLSIGVFKLMILLFSNLSNEKTVHISISVAERCAEADALVDTGNLVKDPMNMYPVLFVKPSFAERLLPENVITLHNIDALDSDYRKRIRLIPVSRGGETHVMTGVRADRVTAIGGWGKSELEVTIAIDKEGGSYGGYELLLPSAALEDVV